ncbi:MAG: F0F1 ATP synthase subunit epsilon [Gammaproteobacteria bacterium]
MTSLSLHLESPRRYEKLEDVVSFVAEDGSGSFGILPGRERMLTVLEFGLARFRTRRGPWQYVAAPGAVVYMAEGELHFSTRHYVLGNDFETIHDALRDEIMEEEQALKEIKLSLQGLEEAMLKRLWEMGRRGRARP